MSITEYIRNILGIRIRDFRIIPESESRYCVEEGDTFRRVSYLEMDVYESSYEEVAEKHGSLNLVKKEIADKIVDFIGKLDEKDYDPQMYIFVRSWDRVCYCDFVYNHKPEIEECVHAILPVKPRGIYASMAPGVNIVYETGDYEKNRINEYEERIKTAILQAADRFVSEKYKEKPDNKVLYIGIWNPDMKGYDGYGISRQD